MYASLLLSMLKRGFIEGPFVNKPHSGPLPPYTVSHCYLASNFISAKVMQ